MRNLIGILQAGLTRFAWREAGDFNGQSVLRHNNFKRHQCFDLTKH
ncbi:MAG: hypothetical protein MSG64_18455 [Pyrinomonadaceae bacterium MAG19_C2-C3]|nr:hypothetical protein [Pyrinomonadaceae bacterium MAG19_C2-C3]